MSRNYPADTAKQRFIEETYRRETAIRLGWYFSPAGRRLTGGSDDPDQQQTPPGPSRQIQVSRRRIEEACPKPTSALLRLRDRYQPPSDYRRRPFRIDALPIASATAATEGAPPTIMEPAPDASTVDALYRGLSHDGRGRADYLRRRCHQAPPEQRYRDPIVSSFEYGWRFGDVLAEPRKPTFARSRLVGDTFYARNGIETLVVPAIR
jgi:hypothetical protein